MGAIQRDNFRFVPEYSVIKQNGAIHVYENGEFKEEIKFSYSGKYPEASKIESLVEEYCIQHNIL